MRQAAAFAATVSVAIVLTLLAALPWGFPPLLSVVPAFVPLVVVCRIAPGAPAPVAASVAFAAGLMLDVLSQGPLGFWALVYLTTMRLSVLSGVFGAGRSRSSNLLVFAGLAGFAALLGLLTASVYTGTWPDVRPYALAATLALFAHVSIELVGATLGALAGGPRERPGGRTW